MRSLLTLAAPLVVLAGCIPAPRPAPPPAVTPPPPAAPAPPPALGADWRDWPLTPGTWFYRTMPGGSVAIFGVTAATPTLSFRCDVPARRIAIVHPGTNPAPLTIRTSTSLRTLPLTAGQAVLGATDPLFEAIGFSRGRFIVEQAGMPPLVLPAWAEIERVTEDCRG